MSFIRSSSSSSSNTASLLKRSAGNLTGKASLRSLLVTPTSVTRPTPASSSSSSSSSRSSYLSIYLPTTFNGLSTVLTRCAANVRAPLISSSSPSSPLDQLFRNVLGLTPLDQPQPQLVPSLQRGSSISIQQLAQEAEAGEGLIGWWNGLLRAVPKKKVSHSRKSMRSANKGLKDRTDLVHCQGCGKPKLQHHLCQHCYSEMTREQKLNQRLSQKSQDKA